MNNSDPNRDPNLTLELNNQEAEELLKEFGKDNTPDNLNRLINHLRTVRVLLPVNVNEKKQPYPCVIKNGKGDIFLPIYTSMKEVPKEPKSAGIMNWTFLAAVDVAVNPQSPMAGLVINPFSNNVIFKPELLERIVQVEKARAEGKLPEGKQVQQIKVTEEQYALLERMRFERNGLPRKFFENTKEFVDMLLKEREEGLDVLFEECYQDKRMYPYLPEDFGIMPMTVSDKLTIIRVDFPTRDMGKGAAVRAYLTYNKETDQGRYYLIEAEEPKNFLLGEISSSLNHVDHGNAPVEGAELQHIVNLAEDKM